MKRHEFTGATMETMAAAVFAWGESNDGFSIDEHLAPMLDTIENHVPGRAASEARDLHPGHVEANFEIERRELMIALDAIMSEWSSGNRNPSRKDLMEPLMDALFSVEYGLATLAVKGVRPDPRFPVSTISLAEIVPPGLRVADPHDPGIKHTIGTSGYRIAWHEGFKMHVGGGDMNELIDIIRAWIQFDWEHFALASDDRLTRGAQNLKRALLKAFAPAETSLQREPA